MFRKIKELIFGKVLNQCDRVLIILRLRSKAQDEGCWGPYKVRVPSEWDRYMDDLYHPRISIMTLRERIKAIECIADVKVDPKLKDGYVELE